MSLLLRLEFDKEATRLGLGSTLFLPMSISTFQFLVLVSLEVFGAIILLARSQDGAHSRIPTGASKVVEPSATPCTAHLGWLEPYQHSYPIRYVFRDIITSPCLNSARPPLTILETPLFDEFTTIDLTGKVTAEILRCLELLVLEVPHPTMPPVDASKMIFGLQTTMSRLKDTVKHLVRWLPHTNARLCAIVIESEEKAADDKEMAALLKQFHDLGMDVTLLHPVSSGDTFAQRYFSLAKVMYDKGDKKTQWLVCIDDDTFLPSLYDLQTMLSKHNASEPQYIGSLSEDWAAATHYGLMGFGGAGIFLSLSMAMIIDEHNDECKESLRSTAGGITVMDCIYRFSTVKLIHIPGLHQIDIHGDLSGFYESGREMLSLHHWKEGSAAGCKLEMEKMHLVADICDSCFLQRWQFSKDIVLSNGYSICEYPQGHISKKKGWGPGVKSIDLGEVEYSWNEKIDVLRSMAPTREKMGEGSKKSYKLLDSVHVDAGDVAVRQVYFREGAEREGQSREMDTVMVLNWRAGDAL